VLRKLEKRGLLDLEDFGAMDVVSSEDQVVEKTGEVYPGLIAAGMAVSTAYGLPRMADLRGHAVFRQKSG